MGYNAHNDKIRDNVGRMQQAWESEREALATARRLNATINAPASAINSAGTALVDQSITSNEE